jgi:hypothetical protein
VRLGDAQFASALENGYAPGEHHCDPGQDVGHLSSVGEILNPPPHVQRMVRQLHDQKYALVAVGPYWAVHQCGGMSANSSVVHDAVQQYDMVAHTLPWECHRWATATIVSTRVQGEAWVLHRNPVVRSTENSLRITARQNRACSLALSLIRTGPARASIA